MHKALSGKGYVKGGEGVFVTSAGEVYAYRDGELTPLTVTAITAKDATDAETLRAIDVLTA